jgi:hypothetical protein
MDGILNLTQSNISRPTEKRLPLHVAFLFPKKTCVARALGLLGGIYATEFWKVHIWVWNPRLFTFVRCEKHDRASSRQGPPSSISPLRWLFLPLITTKYKPFVKSLQTKFRENKMIEKTQKRKKMVQNIIGSSYIFQHGRWNIYTFP